MANTVTHVTKTPTKLSNKRSLQNPETQTPQI